MEIKICKDVRTYRESVVMGLTLRQVICSIGAIGVAVGLFFGLDGILDRETASWICILGATPIAVAGFFSYNGLTVEKFVRAWIKTNITNSGVRLWKGGNHYFDIWRDYVDKNAKKQSFIGKIAERLATKNNPGQYSD